MTIPEAVSLVLQAGAQGVNMDDERGSIYVLDMGEPVKISDLARQMIILSGKIPDTDVEIKYVGLRPGEKLYEELSYQDEQMQQTRSKSILRLKPRATDLRILRQQIQELKGACDGSDAERSRRILKLAVPEFVAAAGSGNEPRNGEGARGL
jgi:O-antigen biosynthesis protein WbqV